MKGLILAAGRGSRLGPHTADKPKSLLEINGKSLIRRNLENFQKVGIDQVILVLGYLKEMLEEEIYSYFPKEFVKILYNPDYTRGSGSTLMCASEELKGSFLVVESDLLYDAKILQRMIDADTDHGLTVGRFHNGRKEIKVYLENGCIANPHWGLEYNDDAIGDWVGFTKLSDSSSAHLKKMLEDTNPNQGKELNYEDFIAKLFKVFPFKPIYINDLPWIEIDNYDDFKRGESEICPRIDNPNRNQ